MDPVEARPGASLLENTSKSRDPALRGLKRHDSRMKMGVKHRGFTLLGSLLTRRTMTQTHDKILIVDFGSQVTQLIARRVREDGVYSEVVPFQKAAEAIRTMKPKGVILSGGPESVTTDASPRAPKELFETGLPVFGIWYGQQTMAGTTPNSAAQKSRFLPRARSSRACGRWARSTQCG
jgi:carbamoylphosphate synthase small subunit